MVRIPTKRKKISLIDNWRKAWKMHSVHISTIGVAVATQYALMYDQMKEILPPKTMAGVMAVVFIVGILARITKQDSVSGDNKK